jgi:hypothetical protein
MPLRFANSGEGGTDFKIKKCRQNLRHEKVFIPAALRPFLRRPPDGFNRKQFNSRRAGQL